MNAEHDRPVGTALAEAARFRLLGLLFERPRPGWIEEVRALAVEVRDPDLRAAAAAARDAREESYLAVLGPGGGVSPREAACKGMDDPGRLLSELAGCYRAFAFRPRAEDPADHVAVEAGFVGYLRLKEAFALARNSGGEAEVTREAASEFLSGHLAGLAESLDRRLENSGAPHLARAARALRRLCPAPDRPPTLAAPPDDPSPRCG